MKSGATESSFYYLSQYYKFPENVDVKRTTYEIIQSTKPYKIIWAHDNCDQVGHKDLPQHIDKIDKIVCVSNWEREQYIKYNRAPTEKLTVIPNGVDDMFRPSGKPKSKTCIFFSAPHKGITPLVPIWKEVIKHHPDAKLKVFSSMSLYENARMNVPEKPEFIRAIEELKSLSEVEYSPCIDREELLPHIQDAAFFIHPNVWEETFCVSLAEAMACGCYPITSDIGALPETSFGRGRYIPMSGNNRPDGWEVSDKFIQEFSQEVSKALEFFDKQPETFYAATEDLSKITRETYDWKKIAELWKSLVEEISQSYAPKYYCMVNSKVSKKYTHQALDTFFRNSIFGKEDKFFLIDNDKTFEFSKDYDKITVISNASPRSFAENMNFVLKLALVDKADFVGLNNDIIFTKNWNENLGDRNSILVPLCNQYVQKSYENLELKYSMELEEFLGKEDALNTIASQIVLEKQNIHPNLMVSFYCFYLPYEVSSKIGLFDENFENGGEDVDYKLRAHQLGIPTKLNHQSYLLHFAAKSTWLSGEDKKTTDEKNSKYYNYFVKKWGKEIADKSLSCSVVDINNNNTIV
jgi:glycosyltransferase involved in cell wall biosynthesis/GT2 family glycosyltransferase